MNKTSKIPLFLMVFLSVFVPFRELIALYTTSYIKFLPDLLVWSYAAFIILKNKLKINVKSYDLLFAMFLLIGLISSLINGTSLLAYALQVRSISTMYIMFYILRNSRLQIEDYRKTSKVLMGVSLTLTIFALIEHISSKLWLFPTVWKDSIIYASNFARTYSLMNNPNTFAFFCYMVMLLVYFINRKNQKTIHYIFYGLTFLAILISASRSTLIVLALFFAFIIYDSINKKSFKMFCRLAALLIAAAVVLIPLDLIKTAVTEKIGNGDTTQNIAMIDRFEEIVSGTTVENSSENGRIFIVKQGIEIFTKHPILGTGFGTYGSAGARMVTPKLYEEYNLYEKFYADNEYIKVFVETGLIGTITYVLFILSMLKHCLNSKYKVLALISFLFIGMFYNIFEFQSICFVLYLILSYIDTEQENNLLQERKCEAVSRENLQQKSKRIL